MAMKSVEQYIYAAKHTWGPESGHDTVWYVPIILHRLVFLYAKRFQMLFKFGTKHESPLSKYVSDLHWEINCWIYTYDTSRGGLEQPYLNQFAPS